MDQGFNKIESLVTGVESRVRGLEQREAGCQPMINQRLDQAMLKINEHDADLRTLKETIAELKHTNKILTWLGGILGSVLLVWLISQLLGLIA